MTTPISREDAARDIAKQHGWKYLGIVQGFICILIGPSYVYDRKDAPLDDALLYLAISERIARMEAEATVNKYGKNILDPSRCGGVR